MQPAALARARTVILASTFPGEVGPLELMNNSAADGGCLRRGLARWRSFVAFRSTQPLTHGEWQPNEGDWGRAECFAGVCRVNLDCRDAKNFQGHSLPNLHDLAPSVSCFSAASPRRQRRQRAFMLSLTNVEHVPRADRGERKRRPKRPRQ